MDIGLREEIVPCRNYITYVDCLEDEADVANIIRKVVTFRHVRAKNNEVVVEKNKKEV